MTTSNALNYYRDLIKSGMPEQQAYDQTTALEKVLEHLVTKEDLTNIKEELDLKANKEDLRELRNFLESKINILDAKIDMTQKWGLGLLLVIFGGIMKVAIWG